MASTRGMNAGGVASRRLSRAWQEGIKGQPWESATPRERRVDTAVFSDVPQEMGWRAQDTPSKVSRAIVGL